MPNFSELRQYLNAGAAIPLRLQILNTKTSAAALRERSRCARHCAALALSRAPRPFRRACCRFHSHADQDPS